MAVQAKAKGNGPNTGMPKSIAPTRPAAPDVVSQVRAPSKASYGMDGFSGASSVDPGQTVTSPLADNMRASVDDDGVLDAIQKNGIRSDLGWQMRDIAAKNVPTHPQMKGASAGPKVPAKLGEAAAPLPKDGYAK